jgi:GT2 family glycosyltransferase
VRLIRNDENVGFAAGQNQAIAATTADWVLTLNPDVELEPTFLAALVEAVPADPRVGVVCGKLRSLETDMSRPARPRLDSTGIYFTSELRHFDRGWGEEDRGQYDHTEFVFGATGAAAMYRRAMIAGVSVCGEFFDEDFFAYREDADLAWRAQLMGWKCLYAPAAVGYHVRRVRPGPRSAVPSLINMHSVKNRFLMRVKNLTGPVWREAWFDTLRRDLLIAAGCLVVERASLPAFARLALGLPRAWRKRREIQLKRTVSGDEMAAWFRQGTSYAEAALAAARAAS